MKEDGNDEEDGDIDAYIAAYDALAAETAKENADEAKVKELTTALDAAAKKLDKTADVKKIQKSTAHQAAYDKEMEAVDGSHTAAVELPRGILVSRKAMLYHCCPQRLQHSKCNETISPP